MSCSFMEKIPGGTSDGKKKKRKRKNIRNPFSINQSDASLHLTRRDGKSNGKHDGQRKKLRKKCKKKGRKSETKRKK